MGTPTWSAIGPAPQNNGSIAYSGRATGLARSSDHDGKGTPALFLATDGGGVWRAVAYTGRPTWQPLTDTVASDPANRFFLSAISAIAVSPNQPRVVYAGSGSGILRSTDGGDTWSLVPNSPMRANRIVVDPRANGTAVWAGGPFGLWISGDGTAWQAATIGPDLGLTSFQVDDLEWIVRADLAHFTLFAALHNTAQGNTGSKHGIYYTTDAGGTWNECAIDPLDHDTNTRLTPASFAHITMAADHTPGSAVAPVAAISKVNADWRKSPLLNVFALRQGSWQAIGGGLPNVDTQGGANQPITVTPTGAIYFAVSGNYSAAAFQSLDGGGSWPDISEAGGVKPHFDHHALLFTDGALYDGNDGGIWRFTPRNDGGSGPGNWEHLNTTGLQTIESQGVSIHPTDPTVVLIGSQDNSIALRSKGVWQTIWVGNSGDGGRVRFLPGTTTAFCETYGGVYRSDDSGANWGGVAFPGGGEFAVGVMQFFDVDNFGSGRIMAAGVHSTWLSSDKGGSWHVVAPGLTGDPNTVTAMCFTSDTAKLYLAFANGQVFQTTNAGKHGTAADWTDISGGTNWGGRIIAIATDPASADAVYLAVDGSRIWRTTNAGGSWVEITADFPAVGCTSIAILGKFGGPNVIVGARSGVYACQHPATPAWRRLGTGFPYVWVTDLCYRPAADVLAAGTYGRGVFMTTVGDITPPALKISWPADECGVSAMEGQVVEVTCNVLSATTGAVYSFDWTVTGAVPASSLKQQTIKIVAPAAGTSATFVASVLDQDGAIGTATAKLTAISWQQAAWIGFFCKLKHLVRVNLWFDPLWDPIRENELHPAVTIADFERIARLGEELVVTARAAATALEHAHHPARIGVVVDRPPPEGIILDNPERDD